jgi:hypothetical protein
LLPGIPLAGEDEDEDDEGAIDSTDYVGIVLPALKEASALLRECRYREFWTFWKSGGGEGGDRESTSAVVTGILPT